VDELGDIVQEFLVESHENLDQLDQDLVALEADPGSRDLLSSIFRTIHTIKGTSGFLAFNRLEKVTHVGESLLARLRDGAQSMTPQTTDALLRMVDCVRELLAAIEETGSDGSGQGDDSDLEPVISAVTACIDNGDGQATRVAAPESASLTVIETVAAEAAAAAAAVTAAVETAAVQAATATAATMEAAAVEAVAPAPPAPDPVVVPTVTDSDAAEIVDAPAPAASKPAPRRGKAKAAPRGRAARTATPPSAGEPAEPTGPVDPAGPTAPPVPAAPPAPAHPHPAEKTPPAARANAPGEHGPEGDAGTRRSIADSSIRVDVDLLDTLMRLVGELVLTRNQLVRAIGEVADPAMNRTGQRLNLITSELQESVMKTRMQAIDNLWAKLPRVVRDLSGSLGKQVRLAMEGRETELDRSLLEAVKDPLTHLVRNAVDHGIEGPAERRANGKDPEGVLTLRAHHEGGHVIVEVCDDGAGIDPDRIADVAVSRGMVTREQLALMDRGEILMLVFRPGFSTAKTVTNVSGRGVGMDVVKTNIERIGGAVAVESVLGEGTTWRLTIPLTLAIIQALTVECGPQRYVIPQVAVHELVYLDGQGGRVIEHAMGAPVYRLRGKLLPLVHLDRTLGVRSHHDGADRDVYVAVLQAEGRRFGLVVDRVLNTEEVVVKPLSARFKDVGVYAGATLLGDGAVALILDVASLARRAHLAADKIERAQPQADATSRTATATVDRLLIAGVGERRVAIPLDMVTRLEEFPVERIERVGNREVVQYRDQILPVVRLAHLLGTYPAEEGATVPVVVYTERGRSVALAVDKILDIVEDVLEARSDVGDDGLLGSAVIQQRVTELLDVRRAILAADPRFDAGADDYQDYSQYQDFQSHDDGHDDVKGQHLAEVRS
jgi:two-component system chemotaxis sensor kinase CheA